MKTKKAKVIFVLSILFALLLALVLWIAWGNSALEISNYTVADRKLPGAFEGYRIAQVSDLHNAEMGEHNEALLEMLQNAHPDMIAITGDLVDSRNTDISVALQFAQKAVRIAPCYYVPGNHESRISQYGQLKEGLMDLGVVVLENQSVEIERNGDTILLLGVKDPSFQSGDMGDHLQELTENRDAFTVLLSHRPELMEVYAENKISLVLAGHAHGGQFRLPFIGGLVAPDQGLFPKYDAGLFREQETAMVVSRGIGNSLFPFRFNNRPEVVLIELRQNETT